MKQTLLRVALAFSIVAAPAAAQDCQTKSSCCASEAKAQVVVEEKAQCGSKCDAEAKAQVVVEEKAQCGSKCDAGAKAQVVVEEKAQCGSTCDAAAKAQVVVQEKAECGSSCTAAEMVVEAVADPAAKLHCAQSTLAQAETELATVKARLVSFEAKSCSSAKSCDVAAAASCCTEQAAATVAEAVTESCCATEMAATSCSALPECPVAAYDVVQTRISKTRAHVAANRARLLVARANRQDAAAPLARQVVEEIPATPAKGCCSGTKVQG